MPKSRQAASKRFILPPVGDVERATRRQSYGPPDGRKNIILSIFARPSLESVLPTRFLTLVILSRPKDGEARLAPRASRPRCPRRRQTPPANHAGWNTG